MLHGIAWSGTFARVENLTLILCTLFVKGPVHSGYFWGEMMLVLVGNKLG